MRLSEGLGLDFKLGVEPTRYDAPILRCVDVVRSAEQRRPETRRPEPFGSDGAEWRSVKEELDVEVSASALEPKEYDESIARL